MRSQRTARPCRQLRDNEATVAEASRPHDAQTAWSKPKQCLIPDLIPHRVTPYEACRGGRRLVVPRGHSRSFPDSTRRITGAHLGFRHRRLCGDSQYPGERNGITINSFTSVSLRPPLCCGV
jgi:hypothetical protein